MNVTVPNPDPKLDLKYIPRAKFEVGKYILTVITIWGYSWVIPGILSYYSYMQWIDPNIENLASITPIFQSLDLFLIVMLSPGVIILLFLLRLFLVVFLGRK